MNKFTQNRSLVILVAFLLLANLGVLAYFLAIKSRKEHSRPSRPDISTMLGLNKDQSATFQKMKDEQKERIQPLMSEIQQLKDSLYEQLKNPSMNDSTITSLANSIGEKQKEWELSFFHHFQRLRTVCTPEQLPKFDSLVNRMIHRGPGMHKGSSGRDKKDSGKTTKQ